MIEITFLGTSCMVPTKERNHVSHFLHFDNEGVLIDCGEGTQRQLKIAGIKYTKITKILISHWHGDHVLGLPGLMQSMAGSNYTKKLQIYGPTGTKKKIDELTKIFDGVGIDFEVKEIKKGTFFENDDFLLEALPLEHQITTLGFRFTEKDKRRINVSKVKKLGIPEGPLLGKLQDGKNITFKGRKISPDDTTYLVNGKIIAFIMDTVLTKNAYVLAKDADLLISEAAFITKDEEKASEHKHMTAKQAALIASSSNVKELILTHFSARYKGLSEIEEDARSVFENVRCAHDFLKVRL